MRRGPEKEFEKNEVLPWLKSKKFIRTIHVSDITRATFGKRKNGEDGWPDVSGHAYSTQPVPYYLELKARGKKGTPEQIKFIEEAKADGCIAGIVDSLDKIKKLFEEAGFR